MSDPGTRRLSAAWLVPMAVLLVVGWIIVDAYRSQGVEVMVSFPDGHGLGRGDMVRCRGIDVGTVTTVQLLGEGVEVTLELAPDSAPRLARTGARWWISRPELDWSRVTGLDSLVGPRFIEVDPPAKVAAGSPEVRSFEGLPAAPIVDRLSSGDLLVILKAVTRGSLHPGASVLYRGVEIGTILSAALADDARTVIAEALIDGRYAPLVRENSIFCQAGAFDLDIGLTGLTARLDSLETLLVGGVTLVTPGASSDPVKPGHEFTVAAECDEDWLEWEPAIPLSSSQ
jgi:paraquat-inducible protein B